MKEQKEYRNQIESLENSAARLARIVKSGFEDVEIELQAELFEETAC